VIHRVNRWYNWRGRRSSEDRFFQRVCDLFGKDAIVAYGNWSENGRNMRGLAPTPSNSLCTRLAQWVLVYRTPEYYTTKSCCRCDNNNLIPDCTRTYLKEVYSEDRTVMEHVRTPLRSIRRCNSVECGGHLRWVRDQNSPINIRSNWLHAMLYGVWNPRFSAQKYFDSPKRSKKSIRPPDEPHPRLLWQVLRQAQARDQLYAH